MHPILGDRRRLAVYLLVWQLIGLLLTSGLRQDVAWTASAAFFLPLSYAYAFVCLSAWYPCCAFRLDAGAKLRNVTMVHVVAGCVASLLWVIVGGVWAAVLQRNLDGFRAAAVYGDRQLTLFLIGVLLFWLSSACHYLLAAFETSREAEARAFELSLLAREAELRALRAQIDPHFIFNSLHSISALTTIDPLAARRMCLLLADFLRETLRLGASARITLEDELALIDRFLQIEQIRLGGRLVIERDADRHAAACLVPPLLLQPVVENAIVHGVGQLVEGGTIRLATSRQGESLIITVENPCDQDRAGSLGVGLGLDLLTKRLATQFGLDASIQAGEQSGRFRVEIRMPALTVA